MNGVIRTFLGLGILISMMLATGCTRHAYDLDYEVRFPMSRPNDITWVEVATTADIQSTPVKPSMGKPAGEFWTYAEAKLIFDGYGHYAIVAERSTHPGEVFVLPFVKSPKAMDWTEWRDPDYADSAEHGRTSMNFMYDGPAGAHSSMLPADHFQVRYRVVRRPEFDIH